MDRAISANEANQRFSEMLREVGEGESFTVLSDGHAVARVVPVDRTAEIRALDRVLAFVENLPIRYSGDWTRDDLYE